MAGLLKRGLDVVVRAAQVAHNVRLKGDGQVEDVLEGVDLKELKVAVDRLLDELGGG